MQGCQEDNSSRVKKDPQKNQRTVWHHRVLGRRWVQHLALVVRIARPKSLAIWHCECSHRRQNRSGSPNRRHFASLDLKKHPDFSHRRPTSQDFRRRLFWHFPVIPDQANIASEKKLFGIASDLGRVKTHPRGQKLPKASQKKAIFREDFEDIQKYYKIQQN